MAELGDLARRSVELIATLQEPSGAYPASPTFSAYRGYCWFRDGSFIADGMSAAGEAGSADRFHEWCARTLEAQRGRVESVVALAHSGRPAPPAQMLPARFAFDGGPGADPWWDFQLDGYGTWLWAVTEHAARHDRDPARWAGAIALVVDYLVASWERSCFDWWEEHDEQVHTSTLGCVGAGLEAVRRAGVLDGPRAEAVDEATAGIRALVAERATADGHLTKWLGRSDVDGSLTALIAPLGWLDPAGPVAHRTVAEVERTLTYAGGVHRFADDVFYGGGRWPLLTGFLGLARLAVGDRAGAMESLRWIASTATAHGELPEQVDGHLLAPDQREQWVERWGPVATPLLWSHGQYLRLWHDLGRP